MEHSLRRVLLLTVLLVGSVLLCSCDLVSTVLRGSGHLSSEPRAAAGVHQVTLAGPGTLTITQGTSSSLTVTGEDNILPHVGTAVQDGQLTIALDAGSYSSIAPTQPIAYALTVPDLDLIELTSAGTIRGSGLHTSRLQLMLSGSGTISLDSVATDDLDIELSGTGTLQATGTTTRQVVTLDGSGAYHGDALVSATTRAGISGSGQATVRVTDTLLVTIAGTGSLQYLGNPQVEQHITGTGRLQHLSGP